MNRRGLLICLSMVLPTALWANRAEGDPRLEKLYGMFIAPCCWRENLLIHSSPMADDLRSEIQRLVAAGKTDKEIEESFLTAYSTRILALPKGLTGQWLSWTPWVFAASGLVFVSRMIWLSIGREKPVSGESAEIALPDSSWEEL